MKIGNLEINKDCPLFLAPMAGVTDLTFRNLCRVQGADVTCTEMVSAKALSYNNKNTHALLKKADGESPIAVQIFGNEPELMANMAAKIQDKFDIIDINMGCPVAKVVNNGEGSALMKDEALAARIVEACVKKVSKPVTVKIRAGFDEEHMNAVSMAKALESAGAAAIAIHGRTRKDMYHGQANWDIIRQVKEAISVPVIGNGDVFSGAAAVRMLAETGVDGIMVARGAQGNPWIFSEIRAALRGAIYVTPNAESRLAMVLAHGRGLCENQGEYVGIREMRKHLAWYTAGLPGSAAFRAAGSEITSFSQLEKLATDFFESVR